MVIVNLFWTFFIIGFVSFGGGYAMIPVIEAEVSKQGWMTAQEFTDIIALAGMSPGPIATNSAIIVGHHVAGLTGSIAAGIGMVLPSLFLVLIISVFFYKINQHRSVKAALYGLKPVITGLIVYAAIRFAMVNGLIGSVSWDTTALAFIFLLSMFAIVKMKMHPVYVILLSGLVGIALF